MNNLVSFMLASAILIGIILCSGCSSYAEPEIKLNTTLKQVNVSPDTLTITYDALVDVTNTGTNNAYNVRIMVLVSTPKDLPEYRFVNENIEIGTVPKHESVSGTGRLSLQMTQSNFDLLSTGKNEAEIETKVTRISSNVMG